MNSIKKLLPILIGVFIIAGGLLIFSSQNLDANPEEDPNCYYDKPNADCDDTSQTTCWCIEVVG